MFRLLITLVCLISFVSLVHAADMVVIHSKNTPFKEGQLLSQDSLINLLAKQEMTVVFASGGAQTVKGPYHGELIDPLPDNKADPKLIADLAQFLTGSVKRDPLEIQVPDEIGWVDIRPPKRFFCVVPSDRVILWRPKSQSRSASLLVIKHKPTGQKVQIEWPANKTRLNWPNNLPVHYNDTYMVTVKNRSGSSFKKLVLYKLPDNFPTKSHKVVWLVGRRCISQANMLLASLRKS